MLLAQALSASGRCKSFDITADGYGRGEGFLAIGMAPRGVIKANEALAIVSATVINQDGRSSSLTAPNGPAQSRLVGKAIIAGHLSPRDVTIVVVHGTGLGSYS